MSYIYHNVKIKLPSGRTIQRHPNGEGSVIKFLQYGTETSLYIPDAKYRDFTLRSILNTSNWNIQLHTTRFNAVTYPYQVNNEYLTDQQLQEKLDSALINGTYQDDWTAKEGTDALLQYYPSSPACNYVRGLVPTGLRGCDIPNLYELCVIQLEKSELDQLDPTVKDNPSKRLSNFFSDYVLTCTEYYWGGHTGGCVLDENGTLQGSYRSSSFRCLPILEL